MVHPQTDPLPWIAEVQTPPEPVPAEASRPAPLLFDAEHRPIRTPDAWSDRRDELLGAWRRFLGSMDAPRKPPRLSVLAEDRVEPQAPEDRPVIRRLVRYEAEPDRPVEAYLLRPEGQAPEQSRPGAVVLHSTVDYTIRQPAGLEGPEDKFIGLHLARRGFVTFCPRCFLWENGPGRYREAVADFHRRHPDAKGTALMLFDAQRAVDALVAEADVDPNRIGAIGHSLGGKEALFLAAFDDRVRATVSSEGGIGIGYSNWDAPWYHGQAARQPGFPLDHGMVLAGVSPRAFLLIGGDAVDGAKSWPYIEECLPVWSLTGAPKALGLFNHGQGHAFPDVAQRRAYKWLEWFLT